MHPLVSAMSEQFRARVGRLHGLRYLAHPEGSDAFPMVVARHRPPGVQGGERLCYVRNYACGPARHQPYIDANLCEDAEFARAPSPRLRPEERPQEEMVAALPVTAAPAIAAPATIAVPTAPLAAETHAETAPTDASSSCARSSYDFADKSEQKPEGAYWLLRGFSASPCAWLDVQPKGGARCERQCRARHCYHARACAVPSCRPRRARANAQAKMTLPFVVVA